MLDILHPEALTWQDIEPAPLSFKLSLDDEVVVDLSLTPGAQTRLSEALLWALTGPAFSEPTYPYNADDLEAYSYTPSRYGSTPDEVLEYLAIHNYVLEGFRYPVPAGDWTTLSEPVEVNLTRPIQIRIVADKAGAGVITQPGSSDGSIGYRFSVVDRELHIIIHNAYLSSSGQDEIGEYYPPELHEVFRSNGGVQQALAILANHEPITLQEAQAYGLTSGGFLNELYMDADDVHIRHVNAVTYQRYGRVPWTGQRVSRVSLVLRTTRGDEFPPHGIALIPPDLFIEIIELDQDVCQSTALNFMWSGKRREYPVE